MLRNRKPDGLRVTDCEENGMLLHVAMPFALFSCVKDGMTSIMMEVLLIGTVAKIR